MIKAKFENIGPIKKAELELGDLTIIAGQNNTGKTYLVYTLYGFLDFRRSDGFDLFYALEYSKAHDVTAKEIAKQLEETGSAKIALDKCKRISDKLIKATSKFFSKEIIHQVFSSPREEFEKASFQFEEKNKFMKGEIPMRNAEGEKILIKYFPQGKNLKFEIDNPQNAVFLEQKFRRLPSFLETIIQKNSAKPFIFSAERFGISLFYKELDFTRNRFVQELQKLSDTKNFDPFKFIEKASARYAMPIQRNVDFTRDLFNIAKQKNELNADAVSLVRNIIGGYYKAEKDVIKFISNRRKENRFEIPSHLASSSARGILNLYFYLKHRAAPGQILMIDEPESHLDPSNQILMARLLAFCVNNGIKVLITTHSDFMIKEINNLIMLHQDFEAKQEFLKKYKKEYTENDRLDPNSVKAYICENGGLSACDIDEGGIREMSVFDDAIDDINLISEELNIYTNVDTVEDD